ncbi:hypothetical protein PVAND_000406 [Polypedilum vanderplanki]|uniref:Chitin-binding type-2 domain-containing protein n=1 Tax=Polypedilum vanderplanki TaxID=319348 RepID=A0A9J6BJW7_POLVA|nr:hypothetical protein PVAND_000406 [Polypedilum vanderplanki]
MKIEITVVILLIFSSFCHCQITIPVDTTTQSTTTPDPTSSTLFPPISVETTTTTILTTIEAPFNPCHGITSGLVPNPENCTKYYSCQNSVINYIGTCQPEMIFYNGACVYGDSETCLPNPVTTTQSISTTITTTIIPESTTTNTNTPPTPSVEPYYPCENIENGYVADLWNCSIYYQCVNFTVRVIHVCQPGQIFLNGRCQPGDISQCWIEETTTTTLPPNPCLGIESGNVPLEENCSMFIVCLNENVSRFETCDSNKIFLEDECIVGDQSTCLPDLDVICENIFFAARPYPGTINQFVGCIRNFPNLMQCEVHEYFDRNSFECIDVNESKKRRNFADMIEIF